MTTIDFTQDELECAADALRRFEQGGKQPAGMELRLWADLPNATKKKWLHKVDVVVGAIRTERARAIYDAGISEIEKGA